MRRHIDEDETPAAPRRRNNRSGKAADARHGFGSPLGMELTDRPLEDVGQQQQQQQQYVRGFDQSEQPQEFQSLQALVDLSSPIPPIDTMSTESETPTPPAIAQGDRQTPPDVADQLVTRGAASSPPRDTPAVGAIRPPLNNNSRRRRGEQGVTFQQGNNSSRYFVSPTPSSGLHSSPTFRPNAYASPMALQALRSPAELVPPRTGQSFGSFDPIQMGTPSTGGSGFPSRLSDVTMTPDRRRTGDLNDSASDSDTEIKEPFSDQVKSLNKLLRSTDTRLGKLGVTTWSPDRLDNDDLTQEEEDLEEIRRQLQQELSMVDYSMLKDDSPARSASGSRRGRQNHIFSDDEQINLASRFSTPDRSKAVTSQRSPSQKNDPPSQQNITSSPLSILMSSTQGRTISPQGESSSSARPTSTGKSPQSKENTGSSTKQQQKTKSPPSQVLVATLAHQQKTGGSPREDLPQKTKQKGSLRGEKQQPQSGMPSGVQDAATEVSHDNSNQSSSSGSGSSSRSSKSLLERFGFRGKSVTSPLVQKGESGKVGANSADVGGYESSGSAPSTGYGDAVSTSASEDSTFDFEDQHTMPLISPKATGVGQTNERQTPLSQTISRLEVQLDGSPNYEEDEKTSQTLRREIAPEPPVTDIKAEARKQSQSSKAEPSGGTLRTQGLLNSLDSLLRPGAQKKKQSASARNLLPKSVKRSDTMSSIGTNSLAFPSDEREFPLESIPLHEKEKQTSTQLAVYAASIEIPNNESELLRGRPPPTKPDQVGRLGSQSSIGSKTFPSDERDPIGYFSTEISGRPASQSSTTPSTRLLPSGERRSWQKKKAEILETEWRPSSHSPPEKDQGQSTFHAQTPDDRDSNWLLQTIGSIGSVQTLSPIVHEDEDPDQGLEIVLSSSDSATKVLFSSSGEDNTYVFDPTQLPGSYSDDTDHKKQDGSISDQQKKKAQASRLKFCGVLLLLIGAGLTIFLALYFSLGQPDPTLSPTASPSISPMPSATPTIAPSPSPTMTPEPTTPAPTNSPTNAPTSTPTKFTISFESVYEIIVWNGGVDDIPTEVYEDDLLKSMDILLEKIGDNIPSNSNRNQRRLQVALLPSSINDFAPTNCPKSGEQDRCEKVFAWITLEGAEDTWTDFKLALELSIAIGQLQFELDQVNPDSPVSIIDLVGEPDPTLSPTQSPSPFPTQISPPTEFDLFAFLIEQSFDDGEALMDEDSPQYQAYIWLSENAQVEDYSEDRLLQRYALATFYFSTHGEDWFFQDLWLSDADECLWYSRSSRPSCNREGQVQNLELDYNNVNGEMPPELGLLSNSMERLVLRGGPSSFSGGTIPPELGKLTGLTHFFIRGNLYSGSIPTELGQWTAIEQFDVSRNNLSGPIPTEFGAFGGLNIMDISTNKLSGEIPTELGNLERCQRLNIENNMLTGPIPSEIGSLRRLQSFHGGSNMLTSLPSEIGRLTFLDTLSLYENELGGTIPTEISRMRRLLLLELGDNALTGPIPSQLGNLFDMRDRIDLSYNHLTGQLPSELGNLDRLRVLELEHNKLSGTIPSEIAGLGRVTTIRLDANSFTGEIPSEVCSVFNLTYPAFSADCSEFVDNCPCCTTCCEDDGVCECRYSGTPQEFLCFQQKKA
jgi:hypothetical protein